MRVSSEGVSEKGDMQKIRNVVGSHWSKVYFLTRGVSVMFVLVVHLCVSLCTVQSVHTVEAANPLHNHAIWENEFREWLININITIYSLLISGVA